MNFKENDKINVSALAVLINDSTIMTVNFTIASILCFRTLRHIRAETTFSACYKRNQFRILQALLAQVNNTSLFSRTISIYFRVLSLFCVCISLFFWALYVHFSFLARAILQLDHGSLFKVSNYKFFFLISS